MDFSSEELHTGLAQGGNQLERGPPPRFLANLTKPIGLSGREGVVSYSLNVSGVTSLVHGSYDPG